MDAWQEILIGAFTALLIYALLLGWLIVVGRREEVRAAVRFVPDFVVLFRRLISDRRVSRRRKIVLAALLPYLALPFDLVPDFIPVAGYLDDAIIVCFVLRRVLRGGERELIEEHWPGPRASLALVLRLAGYEKADRRSSTSSTPRRSPRSHVNS